MKRFKLLFVLFFIFIVSQILPQEKLFTVEDVMLSGQRSTQNEKPLDYFSYVGPGHGVAGGEALHLYTKITNYFLDNL
ncbi:hypothetical protein C0389_02010 [bacterium]|nr:hypothetical protein [bacterium]